MSSPIYSYRPPAVGDVVRLPDGRAGKIDGIFTPDVPIDGARLEDGSLVPIDDLVHVSLPEPRLGMNGYGVPDPDGSRFSADFLSDGYDSPDEAREAAERAYIERANENADAWKQYPGGDWR